MSSASKRTEGTVRLSVLDRLIDRDPGRAMDATIDFGASARALRETLLRDLEWLLNTRRIAEPAPESYVELGRSVYHFGLPDITSLSGDSAEVRRRLARQVEECIALFEPRLSDVRVTPDESGGDGRRRIRFIVEGLLLMEPSPERIVFDTVLETASGRFQVKGGGDA